MSLPKYTASPPFSSSPSKQSIRRTNTDSAAPSRPQSIIDRPSTAYIPDQHHHQHEPNIPPTSPIPDENTHHDLPHSSSSTQPPFQPFFTLIEDTNTAEYYHPTVHYIFSDDDTDIVTEAALRSLESEHDTPFPQNNASAKSKSRSAAPPQHEEEPYDDDQSPQKEPLLPSPVPGIRDNYIILDVDATSLEDLHGASTGAGTGIGTTAPSTRDAGLDATSPGTLPPNHHPAPQFTVTSAHSLTPTWQVLNTNLVPAPTFENNPSSNEGVNGGGGGGGLMLKIQGSGGLPVTMLGKDRDKERISQRLEEMMEQFSKRLGELRLVIEAGERGGFEDGDGALEGKGEGGGAEGNALGLEIGEDGLENGNGQTHDHGHGHDHSHSHGEQMYEGG